MSTKLSFGCDPEVFLRDKITKEFVSAYGLFPGTKSEPFKIDKGAVQVDGMALEFNIEPVDNLEDWLKNLDVVTSQMNEMVTRVNPDFEIVYEPWAEFNPEYFKLLPLEPKILGCDPDFDGNGQEKTPSGELQDLPFRTAAGHVHIGWTKDVDPVSVEHFGKCLNVANSFIKVEGYEPKTNHERMRVAYYGAPPSFRPKSYGVELRSPSNIWVERTSTRARMFQVTAKKARELFK